ncbi:MAG TPA: efflux RND transporter periplasmic adaptor subunit [Gemmatimonadaceae bacterium]
MTTSRSHRGIGNLITWRSLAIGAIWLFAACKSNDTPKKPPATPVRVAAVSRIDAPVNLAASGVVEPMQTVAVTTQVTGALLDVLFREGESVTAGRVLFHIDPRPLQAALDQSRATLARDAAQADAGKRDDARYQALAAKGYVSRSQADQIHATALAQQATVQADRAAVRAAVVNLSYATIRAPISGRTGSLLVRRGNIVSPGSGPLIVINQIRPVLVRFPVADQDFPSVQRALAAHSLPVTATANDSTQPGERGQLAFLDNAIDSLTGTVTGKASFPNAASRLWPGELIFLTIQLDVERNVLAVPNEAVLTGQQGSYVYVVDAQNTARTKNVVTGIGVGDLTVITQGLSAADRVVIDGQSRLNPGSRVALVRESGDTAGRTLSNAGNGGSGTAGGDITGIAATGNGEAGGTPNGSQPASRVGGAGAATATGVTGTNVAGGVNGGRGAAPAVAPAPGMSGVTGTATPNGNAATNAAPNANATRANATSANAATARSAQTATPATSPNAATTRTTTTTTTTKAPTPPPAPPRP